MTDFFSSSDEEEIAFPVRGARQPNERVGPMRYEGFTFTDVMAKLADEVRTNSANEARTLGSILAQDRVTSIEISAEFIRVVAKANAWVRTDEICFRESLSVGTLNKLASIMEAFARTWGITLIAPITHAKMDEDAEDGTQEFMKLCGMGQADDLSNALDSLGPYDIINFRLGTKTAVATLRNKSQAIFPLQQRITCGQLKKKCQRLTGQVKTKLFKTTTTPGHQGN